MITPIDITSELLHAAARHILSLAKIIIDKEHFATGHLKRSLNKDIVKTEKEIKEIRFYSTADHAAYIHEGTVPHHPPIKPLVKWIYRKGLLSDMYSKAPKRLLPEFQQNKKSASYRENLEKEKEARNIAFAIAKKIQKKGTPSYPFFNIAAEKVLSEL